MKKLQKDAFEENLNLRMMLIDYKQTYNIIRRSYTKRSETINTKTFEQSSTNNDEKNAGKVPLEGGAPREFTVETGLRQRNLLSTTLFNFNPKNDLEGKRDGKQVPNIWMQTSVLGVCGRYGVHG